MNIKKYLTGFLWVVLLSGSLTVWAQPSEHPNVIVILADDQGWGATSVQMDPRIAESASDFYRTPNLEKMAASGMRFTQAYAPHPNCSPTRASLQTGMTPAKLHFTDIIERRGGNENTQNPLIRPRHVGSLQDSLTTIAELIRMHRPEYATAHFGKWHMGGGGPVRHGYDEGDGATSNREGNLKLDYNPKDIFGIARRGNAFMEKNVEKGKPFFMMLAHYATHRRIEHLPSTLHRFQEMDKGERHASVPHAAMTADLDTGVGMTLNKIKELGISDNTYIVYMADNGTYPRINPPNPSNTNGPVRGWKATLWEGGIRVPFIIAGPGIKPNTVSRERVVGFDLYPTIAEWLGIESIPHGVEGGSLNEVLKNSGEGSVSRPNDFLVFHWPRYVLPKGSHPASVIFKGNYKLHKFYETKELRLYNMEDDLAENNILNDKHPEKVRELHRDLQHYLERVDAGMTRPNPNYSPEEDPANRYREIRAELMEETR